MTAALGALNLRRWIGLMRLIPAGIAGPILPKWIGIYSRWSARLESLA
jgi:hypothetical protein